MATSLERALDDTPIRGITHEEQHKAAISMAEVALARKRRTDKFRIQQVKIVLEALGIDLAEIKEEETLDESLPR